ncbi:hypothetical protein AAG565_09555 [Fontimonas sp. SYSU GA230001]|uniref:hypothetical protein n=1 Tax=Fontimonas sp. SYSU GA230001 TaxID=3142450 RepID=UPI0032B437DF
MVRLHRFVMVMGVLVLAAMPAQARKPASAPAAADGWISFGGGYYNGQDYEAPAGSPKGDAERVGGYEAMLAFNHAGPVLLRLRSTWMFDFTSNTAEEVAALVGLPLAPGRQLYLAAGVSRLTDVSNTQQSPTVGVPIELLFYPTRGLEVGVHGNLNPDSDFIGFTFGGVFGKQRAP